MFSDLTRKKNFLLQEMVGVGGGGGGGPPPASRASHRISGHYVHRCQQQEFRVDVVIRRQKFFQSFGKRFGQLVGSLDNPGEAIRRPSRERRMAYRLEWAHYFQQPFRITDEALPLNHP